MCFPPYSRLIPFRRFRWVYCQIETLRHCFPPSIRHALDELPETLDGTYEQTLRMIDKQKRDYACRLFQCLVIPKRPLRVEELAELFAIQPDVGTIPTFDAGWRPEDPEDFILSACSTLVAVVNVDGQKIVQFSHFSVREYLISDRIANSEHVSRFHVLPRLAHAHLARACLTVLLQLKDGVDRDNIRNFPLALYAAQYWVDHAQFENVALDIQPAMKCLFDKNKPHFAAWLRLYNVDDPLDILMATLHHTCPYPVPLYYAALCGFRNIAEHLIDAHPQDVNARGGKHVTPLHAALEEGHPSVAMLLVDRGADMGSRDTLGQIPLHIASYRGYNEVASLLIDNGADPNAKENTRKTPLHHASEKGHDEIVRLLFDHDADANHRDYLGLTPLHLASQEGHNEIVRLLLNHGADVNRPDNNKWTPLHYASDRGHDESVWLLFDPMLHEHLPDGCMAPRPPPPSPPHVTQRQSHDEIVRLLLNHGADANHPDYLGWTPVHHASRMGYYDIIQLLLDHGADTNRPEDHGLTPLHLASKEGHNDIVQLLLNHGDANLRD
jgi:ankyrin repeat protein